MSTPSAAPGETVAAWADAWRQLDAGAVSDLFTADATYVAALSGPVSDLRRSFAVATRTWAECRLENLAITSEGHDDGVTRVGATYRFVGITRRGTNVTYEAAAAFGLRPVGDGWRIASFFESFAPGTGAHAPGGGMDTV